MNNFFDYRLSLMCGIDLPIPQCQLIVHQPKLEEIALIGEDIFFMGAQCLCINKTMFVEDKNLLETTSNFQVFMMIMTDSMAKDKKCATMSVLNLLFPDYNIFLVPNQSLIFQKKSNIDQEKKENILIDKENFEIFQNVLKEIFCIKDGPQDQQSFNPANKKAKEIADKIMRGRQKVAEQKGTTNVSIFTQYISVLTVGLHSMPISELRQLTMFQLYDLVERYMLYVNWDLDVKQRLAGATPEEHPDNWMKNIH